jgi:ABC-type tungstate transport system permease subunit
MEYGPAKPTAHNELLAGSSPFNVSAFKPEKDWGAFQPPRQLLINHPWLCRHCPSALLYFDHGLAGSNMISTETHDIYGPRDKPVLFRIGCGSAGYTGIFKALSELYIGMHGGDFSIGMVRNISRHTQVALLSEVVQIAFTQEPHNEDLAINEGWCKRACKVLNDHFVLVGPTTNPAGIQSSNLPEALQTMVAQGSSQPYNQMLFHSNGDGSSTFFKKHKLWLAAGIDVSNAKWSKQYAHSPFSALKNAARESAYILTDRATYLTAKHHGLIPRMRVFAEGGVDLVNPCSALLNTVVRDESTQAAALFANWLNSPEAQNIIREYGKDWSYSKPLFTVAEQEEFEEHDGLSGRL